ncbi:hypothetical protein ACYATM_00465 [Lactobacillaceae bacterium Scapto_B20]
MIALLGLLEATVAADLLIPATSDADELVSLLAMLAALAYEEAN